MPRRRAFATLGYTPPLGIGATVHTCVRATVDDQGTRLLVKVAQLYHLQGQNQDQIARQFGVSRSKVSRMLKEARERGLVEITIHYPSRFSLDLERRLESELGLREAVVVNTGGMAGGQAT